MSSGIFHIDSDGKLIELNQTEYASEELLQSLLANYPSLIPGDQIDELNPRKWIFIARELSIPDSDISGGRWSLDHLFLDQDGIPTLIETKRSSDTRIRREVVGQMLDYAANATSYWQVERIKAQFEASSDDPQSDLSVVFGADMDYLQYWNVVGDNLNKGRIRMLFVADEIPFELKQIIEFLNEQMNPAEVFAVEIKQYLSGDIRTLVPRVSGQTATLQSKKSKSGVKTKWDEQSFMTEVERRNDSLVRDSAKQLLDWGIANNLEIWFGEGKQLGSFFPLLTYNGETYWLFAVWTNGFIEIQFQWMKTRPIFDNKELRYELLNELNKIPGIDIPEDGIDRRPSFPIAELSKSDTLDRFLSIWGNYIDRIRGK